MSYKVLIIQKRLPHYRKPFFEALKNELAQRDIELVLVYGNPSKEQLKRQDNIEIDWAYKINNREIRLGRWGTLIWQPCIRYILDVDLVIVEQASKLLINYLLFILRKVYKFKLAFWGHGISFLKNDAASAEERIKQKLSKKVDWWFAYNNKSASVVQSLGFSVNKITSVQNTIDTKLLVGAYKKISSEKLSDFRAENGFHSENTALFIGSLYAERGIDFLLATCQHLRRIQPDFEIVIVGAGTEADRVKSLAKEKKWIHYVGAVFEAEMKAILFKLAKVILLPGPVGLVVIESFATETPLITLNLPTHGPEIDYIISGYNGVIVPEPYDTVTYAEKVVQCMNDTTLLKQLQLGCQESHRKYSIDTMAQQFGCGIDQVLTQRNA